MIFLATSCLSMRGGMDRSGGLRWHQGHGAEQDSLIRKSGSKLIALNACQIHMHTPPHSEFQSQEVTSMIDLHHHSRTLVLACLMFI